MKMINYAFLLAIELLLLACDFGRKTEPCSDYPFVSEIPKWYTDTISEQARKREFALLKIPKLDSGSNNFQLRIWYGYPNSSYEDLIIIKRCDNKWEGELWLLEYRHNFRGQLELIENRKTNVLPKCGWPLFIDSLITNGILTIKDCESIAGYEMRGDGENIFIEAASCNRYRIVSYTNPWLVIDRFEEARKVVNLSKIVERQLSFQRRYPIE